MAEEIEIKNIGGQNGVASEATLQRLVTAMTALAKATGNNSDQAAKAMKAFEKSVKSSTTAVDKNEDAFKDNTSAIKRSTNAIGGMASAIANLALGAVNELGGSMIGLSKELLIGGNRIGDFARHLPFVGDQLGALGGFLDNQIDMYRDLSGTGVNFNNSLIDMNRAAINAEMSMGLFAEIVGSNSSRMAFFGTNVDGGANAFGNLQKRLRDGRLGEQLFSMGFTITDINEGLLNYTQQQARLGRLEGMSQSQLIEGSRNYLQEIDRLARVTGMNRKEIEQERLARAQEANMMVMRNRLLGDTEALANFDASMDAAAQMGPEFALALKDAADGVVQTDVGRRFASLSDDFLPMAMAIGRGQVGIEEFQRRMGPISNQLNNFAEGLGPAGIQATEGLAGLGGLFGSLFQINEFVSKTFNEEEARAAQARRDALTSLGTQFNNTVETLRASLLDKLINNGTFENIQRLFDETFEEGTMSTFTDNIANFMAEFTEDPKGKIREVFNEAKNGFMDFMFGNSDELGNRYGGFIDETIVPMFRQITNKLTTIWDDMKQPLIEGMQNMLKFALDEIILYLADNTIFFSGAAEEIRQQRAEAEALANATPEEIQAAREATAQGINPDATPLEQTIENQELADPQSDINRGFIADEIGYQLGRFNSASMSGATFLASDHRMRLLGAIDEFKAAGGVFADLPQEMQTAFPDDLKFRNGTNGFKDFGEGTLAVLHGREAVVPENSPEGQMLTRGNLGATMNQDGVINAVNQLNSTMSQATALLSEIKMLNKKQLGATRDMGAVY